MHPNKSNNIIFVKAKSISFKKNITMIKICGNKAALEIVRCGDFFESCKKEKYIYDGLYMIVNYTCYAIYVLLLIYNTL